MERQRKGREYPSFSLRLHPHAVFRRNASSLGHSPGSLHERIPTGELIPHAVTHPRQGLPSAEKSTAPTGTRRCSELLQEDASRRIRVRNSSLLRHSPGSLHDLLPEGELIPHAVMHPEHGSPETSEPKPNLSESDFINNAPTSFPRFSSV